VTVLIALMAGGTGASRDGEGDTDRNRRGTGADTNRGQLIPRSVGSAPGPSPRSSGNPKRDMRGKVPTVKAARFTSMVTAPVLVAYARATHSRPIAAEPLEFPPGFAFVY
jgi:hypothetical protein